MLGGGVSAGGALRRAGESELTLDRDELLTEHATSLVQLIVYGLELLDLLLLLLQLALLQALGDAHVVVFEVPRNGTVTCAVPSRRTVKSWRKNGTRFQGSLLLRQCDLGHVVVSTETSSKCNAKAGYILSMHEGVWLHGCMAARWCPFVFVNVWLFDYNVLLTA